MEQQPLESKGRDILIKLETTVNLQHAETIGKIDDLKTQLKVISDGATAQLNEHEARIMMLEKSRDELASLKITDISLSNNKKIGRLEDISKFVWGLVALLGGAIIWLLTVVNSYLQINHR